MTIMIEEDHITSYVRHNRCADQSSLASKVDEVINAKESALGVSRVKSGLSRGVWCADNNAVQVMLNHNIGPHFGFVHNGVRYLKREEALFLMESQVLEIWNEQIAISIEEAFDLFFRDGNHIDLYRVYAHLSRCGYFVKVCDGVRPTSEKRKRKLANNDDMPLFKHVLLDANNDEIKSKPNYSMTNIRVFNKHLLTNCEIESKSNNNECDFSDSTNLSILYDMKEVDRTEPQLLNCLMKGEIKPLLNKRDSIYTTTQLFDLMQSFGPKLTSLNDTHSTTNSLFSLEVYKNKSKLDECPLFYVITTEAKNSVLNVDQLFQLYSYSSFTNIYIAVIDEGDINFYCFLPFKLNDEFPLLWEKYLKPI